jgi:signal transduction histidine kinase
MTPHDFADAIATYRASLADYLSTRGEAALYHASLLGSRFVDSGLGPEEIIAVHAEALEHAVEGLTPRQVAGAGVDGLQFLLEVMIAYGVQYQQLLEIRAAEQAKQAEEVRRRLEALERSSHVQADVLATVSHELRTPVTVVQGSLEMVSRHLARQQVERVPSFIDAARQALSRLSRLTVDLYQASRGVAPELTHTPQDLVLIATQAQAWAEGPAVEKGLSIVAELSSRPLMIMGDGDALLSVLANLVSNAIRYTPSAVSA